MAQRVRRRSPDSWLFDDDNGLKILLLQRVLERRDLVHGGDRARRPENRVFFRRQTMECYPSLGKVTGSYAPAIGLELPAVRTYRGRIAYVHDRSGERGREWFTVSVGPGQRTVQAHCELDDVALLRYVTYSVDRLWRPLDAFVRLAKAGRFVGASAFWFDDRGVACEGLTESDGRFSQRVNLPQRATLFGPHALVTDGWQAAAFDYARGTGRQRLEHCTNSSLAPDGGTGPSVNVVYKDLEYCGDERVTVAVGTFVARHMKIHPLMDAMADWPPLEFWVAGEDFLLLRMRWELLESTYELVELSGEVE